jgi:hypothetical protein
MMPRGSRWVFCLLLCWVGRASAAAGLCRNSDILSLNGQEEVYTVRTEEDAARRKKHSATPCAVTNTLNREQGDFVATFDNVTCLHVKIEADGPVSLCFLPDIVWYALGRVAVQSDHDLCPCQNVKTCEHKYPKVKRLQAPVAVARPWLTVLCCSWPLARHT